MRQAALVLALLATMGGTYAPSSAQATEGGQDTPPTLTGSALIDQQIAKVWAEAGVVHAGPSDDAEFLRRLSLDLVSLPPSPEETLEFIKDTNPGKRAAKVDQLLARPEYAHAWAELWESLLIGYDERRRTDSKHGLYTWLRDEVFAKNLPYDKMVAALLTATGVNTENGPVNFLIRVNGGGSIAMASRLSRLFMSTQIQCAECHDHPFDRFTQEDFYGMVAFFARTRGRGVSRVGGDGRFELFEVSKGEASFGAGKEKKTVAPRFLDETDPPKDVSRREAFARLLIRPENRLFAKAVVNRYWARFFGRGIIDPVDDFSNRFKPSHPELLDRLSKEFVAQGHDLAWLIRTIVNSKTYQLSSRKPENASADRFFSTAATRPLTPEQLHASLKAVLGLQNGRGLLQQLRQRFGDEEQADRGSYEGTIPQALMTMNGSTNGEIGRANNCLDKILKQFPAPEERLKRIFLTVLCRLPSPHEAATYLPFVKAAGGNKEPYEDVVWVLLNSGEFLFNH
jgi:uncharacterized protein DUF1549/uncharacterized protein DUF1553